MVYSRFWADKQGKVATGFPTSIKMAGGDSSIDDMIASTERGVLVTRLWYLRQVDPRTIPTIQPRIISSETDSFDEILDVVGYGGLID